MPHVLQLACSRSCCRAHRVLCRAAQVLLLLLQEAQLTCSCGRSVAQPWAGWAEACVQLAAAHGAVEVSKGVLEGCGGCCKVRRAPPELLLLRSCDAAIVVASLPVLLVVRELRARGCCAVSKVQPAWLDAAKLPDPAWRAVAWGVPGPL